jgi:hypothetical protein
MYDPRRIRSAGTSLDDVWLPVIDAFDLTDASSMYDAASNYYHAIDQQSYGIDPASSSSWGSHFYMDLTRFGTYADAVSNDQQTMSAATSYPTSPRYYEGFYHPNLQDRSLATPSPPTPIPEFRIFDLTCFIEDSSSQGLPSNKNRNAPNSPQYTHHDIQKPPQPRLLYKLAPPKQDYQGVMAATNHCPESYPTPAQTTRKEVRESQRIVHSFSEEEPEEHSTIHLTDFSRSSGPVQADDLYHLSSYNSATCGSHVDDLFAIHCDLQRMRDDNCEHYFFDRMCRGKRPNETFLLADATTSVSTAREEDIRSCGTLPPQVTTEKRRGGKTRKTQKQAVRRGKNVQERPVSVDKRNGKVKKFFPRQITDFTSKVDKVSTSSMDTEDDERPRMFDSNESQTEAGCDAGANTYKSLSSSSEGTATTEDSFDYSVADRREWMGSYIRDLFDIDETKAIFYASNIAERRHHVPSTKAEKDEKKKRKGGIIGDFVAINDYCRYVMRNLDLAEVVENIDEGVYDDHLDDFQEDIELCFEDAIAKYEKLLEAKNRKWERKGKDNGSSHTLQVHKDLRLLAGEELMKQLETDFKMQLLDRFCEQVTKHQLTLRKASI